MTSAEKPAPDQTPAPASAEPVRAPPPGNAPAPPPMPGAPSRGAWRRWVFRVLGAVALLLVLFEGVPWVRDALRDGLDGRRLRERPRDVRRPARRRAGGARAGRRQQPRAQGRPARAARPGAVPGAGEHRRRRRSTRRRPIWSPRPGAGARRRRPDAQPRFNLEHAIEEVDNQVALLRSQVADARTRSKATLAKAQADYDRARAARRVAARSSTRGARQLARRRCASPQAQVEEALQGVYQVRVVARPAAQAAKRATTSTQVPPDLNQTFSVGPPGAGQR